MREINLWDLEQVKIGHAQDEKAATGCTVILCEKGAPTGVDIRGGGPASRETPLLNPVANCQGIHGILLSGGSAFGLDAAGGVMQYLEERGIGYDVGITKVPLVCEACIFDLAVGSAQARPDKQMAYAACLAAEENRPGEGAVGAGTGATVGKFFGPGFMMKSGLGICAVEVGDLKMAAIAVVNALGDVFHWQTGEKLAGLLNKEKNGFQSTEEAMYQAYAHSKNLFVGNTTLGVILTNALFDKTAMNKVAMMAHNGYARTIRPLNTTADGDIVFAMSAGDVSADINVVGTLASEVMAKAINRAVIMAKPAYGLKAASDFS